MLVCWNWIPSICHLTLTPRRFRTAFHPSLELHPIWYLFRGQANEFRIRSLRSRSVTPKFMFRFPSLKLKSNSWNKYRGDEKVEHSISPRETSKGPKGRIAVNPRWKKKKCKNRVWESRMDVQREKWDFSPKDFPGMSIPVQENWTNCIFAGRIYLHQRWFSGEIPASSIHGSESTTKGHWYPCSHTHVPMASLGSLMKRVSCLGIASNSRNFGLFQGL